MLFVKKLKNGKKFSALTQWANGEKFTLLKLALFEIAEDCTIYWFALRITWLSVEIFTED